MNLLLHQSQTTHRVIIDCAVPHSEFEAIEAPSCLFPLAACIRIMIEKRVLMWSTWCTWWLLYSAHIAFSRKEHSCVISLQLRLTGLVWTVSFHRICQWQLFRANWQLLDGVMSAAEKQLRKTDEMQPRHVLRLTVHSAMQVASSPEQSAKEP